MTPEQLLEIANGVLSGAAANEQIEVACSHGRSTSIKAYEGEVESMTAAESMGLGVRVLIDGKEGFASAGSLDGDVVADTFAQARSNAVFAERDEFVGIAEPDGVDAADIELWSNEVDSMASETKVQMALDIEKRVRTGHDKIVGVRTATYGDSVSSIALASTSGIQAATRATSAGVSVQALAEDSDGTQTGYGYDGAIRPSDLSLDNVVDDAISRSVDLLGSTKPDSAKIDLVLEPRMVATVYGLIASTLSGDRILKGRSPFVGRLGQQVASDKLTLVDDPTDVRSLAASSHDGEGLACRRNQLITNGELKSYLHDSYTGRRSGEGSTGSATRGVRGLPSPGVQALAVAPGSATMDELIADVELGLFAFSLTGLHSGVNPVSGDFSVGVVGRMIRDGELAEPIGECTIGSTLQRLMLDIKTVGGEVTYLPSGVTAPPIVLSGIALAGN